MEYIKKLHNFLDKSYRLFLPMMVIMSVLLQLLYLFPSNFIFFSINQIFVDFIVVTLVFWVLFSTFTFIFFIWYTFFKWKPQKVYNFWMLLLVVYFLFWNVKESLITWAFFWAVWWFFALSSKFDKLDDFNPYIFYYCVLLTPFIIFLNNSFNFVEKAFINNTEYSIEYFNSDYFFLSNGNVFDKDGNKFIKSDK